MELKRLPIYLQLESDSNYDGSADERNRMLVESVRSELVIFWNLSYSCQEFKDMVSGNKHLIMAAQSDTKYHKWTVNCLAYVILILAAIALIL